VKVEGDFPEATWMVTLRGTRARRAAVRWMNPTAAMVTPLRGGSWDGAFAGQTRCLGG